jgi:outer membrane lipoprotein-sorting protein
VWISSARADEAPPPAEEPAPGAQPEKEPAPAAEKGQGEAEPEDAPVKESLPELLKRIEAGQKDAKDMRGDFEQIRFLPLFGDEIRSGGRFAFRKPDQVRWEYTRPHESILVVRGDRGQKWARATNRVEDFRLADDKGLDAVVRQLFTWFRGEFSKLPDDYSVEVLGRGPIRLKLTPRSEATRRFVACIEVALTEGDRELESVKVVDPAQPGEAEPGYTLYRFTGTKMDTGIADSEFRLRAGGR